MNKFVVVVFPNEAKAYEGLRAMNELHAAGAVSVFATSVIERDRDGKIEVLQRAPEGRVGFGVGSLIGMMVGMFAGPAGMVGGWALGGLAGSWRDYLHAEVSKEFLEDVQDKLAPGMCAVCAEVSEEWTTPLDLRMVELGGIVVREGRETFVDDLMTQRIDTRKKEYAQWKDEHAAHKAERMAGKLMSDVNDAKAKLERSADQARERLQWTREELQAKLQALDEQAQKASPETRATIEKRIAEVRADFAARQQKLTRAFELAQEALRP